MKLSAKVPVGHFGIPLFSFFKILTLNWNINRVSFELFLTVMCFDRYLTQKHYSWPAESEFLRYLYPFPSHKPIRIPLQGCPAKLVFQFETTENGTETSFDTIRNKMFVSVVSVLLYIGTACFGLGVSIEPTQNRNKRNKPKKVKFIWETNFGRLIFKWIWFPWNHFFVDFFYLNVFRKNFY
jgi:hypothetical protein